MTLVILCLLASLLASASAVALVHEGQAGAKLTSSSDTGRQRPKKNASNALARREEKADMLLQRPLLGLSVPDANVADSEQLASGLQSRDTRAPAYNDALMHDVRDKLSEYRKQMEARVLETSKMVTVNKQSKMGTIVVMLDTTDIRQMHDVRTVLVPSLMNHIKFSTSVVVLYTGSRRHAEDATINLHLNTFLTPHLEDVTDRIQQVSHEESHTCKKDKQSDNWKINQFWTMHVHELPELQGFKYAWWLSPSSSIDADITVDLYEVMKEKKAVFGFRSLRNDKAEACAGLEDAAKTFFQEHSSLSPQLLNSKTYLSLFEEAKCPTWSPDFQITDLDYLRTSGVYQQFVKHLSQMGGFCKFGWGGQGIQAMFIETLEPDKQRLLCTKPWVPKFHGAKSSIDCQDGQSLIAFLRDSMNEQLHAPQVSMGEVQEVKHNNTLKGYTASHSQASAGTRFLVRPLAFVIHIWRRFKGVIGPLVIIGLLGVVNIGGYMYLQSLRTQQKQDKDAARETMESESMHQ